MWQFISQNWWIFLFIAIMFFMHRSGAGCCGGGKKHGQPRDSLEKDLQNKTTGDAGRYGGHKSK